MDIAHIILLWGMFGPSCDGFYDVDFGDVIDQSGSRPIDCRSNDNGADDNSPPTVTGTPPASIKIGQLYDFQPVATDPDGDSLSFSIANKPRWASFDSTGGRLSGRPAAGDGGIYPDITIFVSDGVRTKALGPFSVTVHQTGNGALSLQWLPPSRNEDGSPLLGLSGYRLYYGTQPGVHDQVIAINNPGITSYVIDQLLPGTYYVAATAVSSSGIESRKSAEAVRRVH